MKKIKKVLALVLVICLCAGFTACGKDYDAKGFAQAKLNLLFQGDTEGMKKYSDKTLVELQNEYDQQIDNLVYSMLTTEMSVDDTTFAKYANLFKQIMNVTQYSVKGVKKVDKKEYTVTVETATEDVFITFIPKLKELSAEINQDKKDGFYTGTDEEIAQAMTDDYLNAAYQLLEESYKEMKTGDKIAVKLTVSSDDGKAFDISDEDISNLLTKILRFDEIQG